MGLICEPDGCADFVFAHLQRPRKDKVGRGRKCEHCIGGARRGVGPRREWQGLWSLSIEHFAFCIWYWGEPGAGVVKTAPGKVGEKDDQLAAVIRAEVASEAQ